MAEPVAEGPQPAEEAEPIGPNPPDKPSHKDYIPQNPLRNAEDVPEAAIGLRDNDDAMKLLRVQDAWVSVRFAFDKQVR